jgi:hypothetical protein
MYSYQGTLYMGFLVNTTSPTHPGYDISVATLTQKGQPTDTWDLPVTPTGTTALEPAYEPCFSMYNDKLYIYFTDSTNLRYVFYNNDKNAWGGVKTINTDATPNGVAAATQNDKAYLLLSTEGKDVYVGQLKSPSEVEKWIKLTPTNCNIQANRPVAATMCAGIPYTKWWKIYIVWQDVADRDTDRSAVDDDQNAALCECFLGVAENNPPWPGL